MRLKTTSLVTLGLTCLLVTLVGTLFLAAASPAQAETGLVSGEQLFSDVACGSTGANCSGYTKQQVTSNDMYNKLPRINNLGSLVWQAKVNDHFQIFYKGVAADAPVQITNNSLDNTDPQINDAEELVWMGGDSRHSEIYLYSKGVTSQLTANGLANRHPKLNRGGEVVWIAGVADGEGKVAVFEVYRYAAGVVSQVTNNNKFNVQVRINDAGTVLWRGMGGSETAFDIYTRSGEVTTQVTSDEGVKLNPALSNNGQMVWERHDGSDDEIFLKSNQSAVPLQITSNDGNDCYPQVNDQGTVVWQGYDGSHWQIFMYADGVTTKLTDAAVEHTGPRLNAAGDIAWMVHDAEGIGIAVYRAASKKQTKISGSYIGHYSQMVDLNNQGKVVWAGSDGKDFEIVLALPQ